MGARKKRSMLGLEPLSLSTARQRFSPLVQQLARAPRVEVPISVHGKVRAYLLSAEHLAELKLQEPSSRRSARPPRIRGTLKLLGDIDEALQRAKREAEKALLEDVVG